MDSLRATRANPPSLAATDKRRRETYGAALQQFGELMEAAAEVSAMSRPMLLYYAMHQAGKAIAAARTPGNDCMVSGHGLTQNTKDHAWRKDILKFRVKPSENPGVFGAMAGILGSQRLTGAVEIGALWAALPDSGLPYEGLLPGLPAYMAIAPTFTEPPRMYSGLAGHIDFGDFPALSDAAAINGLLARYPGAVGMTAMTHDGALVPWPAPSGNCFQVMCGPDPSAAEDDGELETIESYVAKRFLDYPSPLGALWLVPPVGDDNNQLPPLLLWWILLYGLSLLPALRRVLRGSRGDPAVDGAQAPELGSRAG